MLSYYKIVLVLLVAFLTSSLQFNVEARVKKRRSNNHTTTTKTMSIPEGYSFELLNAAKAGDTDAQTYLGICYQEGNGVQQNKEQALYWYDKAAAKGNAYAQAYAAMMYILGEGTEADETKGFQLAMASANQHNAYGEYILGQCYLNGVGVEEDVKEAWTWLNRSSALGFEHAKDALDKILDDEDLAFEATYDYKDWTTDLKAWNKAKSINTAIAYQKYLELYPSGNYVDAANEAYIDRLVNKTNQGQYIPLPEATKVKSSFGTEATTDISNKTPYKIEVVYKGPEKRRIVIPAYSERIITMKKGTYEIVAKAPGQRVIPYYGTNTYDGDYEEEYYIKQ